MVMNRTSRSGRQGRKNFSPIFTAQTKLLKLQNSIAKKKTSKETAKLKDLARKEKQIISLKSKIAKSSTVNLSKEEKALIKARNERIKARNEQIKKNSIRLGKATKKTGKQIIKFLNKF